MLVDGGRAKSQAEIDLFIFFARDSMIQFLVGPDYFVNN